MRWASIVSLLWLTPAMDRLFAEGAAGRRRFLDRLVLAIDSAHAARVAAFERASRERSHLLRAGRRDAAWLGAIEQRIAEAGGRGHRGPPRAGAPTSTASWHGPSTISPARAWPSSASSRAGSTRCRPWRPSSGWRRRWPRSRDEDAQSGGTAVGPHRSDLVATDSLRGEAAARCSTGRQKAYLISVVLAQARLRLRRHGDLPILLLDEVTAHLDPRRRVELLHALVDLGAQCWLTGTEARLFDPILRLAALLPCRQRSADAP